jgi:hypothetical protein
VTVKFTDILDIVQKFFKYNLSESESVFVSIFTEENVHSVGPVGQPWCHLLACLKTSSRLEVPQVIVIFRAIGLLVHWVYISEMLGLNETEFGQLPFQSVRQLLKKNEYRSIRVPLT